MDLGRAISYPMKGANWKVKAVIGAVLSFIPIVQFVSFGYALRAIKAVMNEEEDDSPEWDDFSGDLGRGFVVCLGIFIYFLPLVIFACCAGAVSSVVGDGDLYTAISCCTNLCLLIYCAAITPFIAAAVTQFAATEDFNGSFLSFDKRFNEVTSHASESFLLVLFLMVIGVISSALTFSTLWICGLGLVVAWLAALAATHLVAQYGRVIGVLGSVGSSAPSNTETLSS